MKHSLQTSQKEHLSLASLDPHSLYNQFLHLPTNLDHMGKSRGRGRGGRGRGGGRRGVDEDESSGDDFDYKPERGQAATAGMLPPSDSDEDSDDDGAPVGGQSRTVGMLPPNSSDEEEGSSSEEDSDSDIRRQPRRMVQPEPSRRKKDEIDPADLAADMARLEIIRKRREEQRLQRIKEEGWDRFAPLSETNKPPGTALPSDHPSLKGANGATGDDSD